jgi:hypothetical protein
MSALLLRNASCGPGWGRSSIVDPDRELLWFISGFSFLGEINDNFVRVDVNVLLLDALFSESLRHSPF